MSPALPGGIFTTEPLFLACDIFPTDLTWLQSAFHTQGLWCEVPLTWMVQAAGRGSSPKSPHFHPPPPEKGGQIPSLSYLIIVCLISKHPAYSPGIREVSYDAAEKGQEERWVTSVQLSDFIKLHYSVNTERSQYVHLLCCQVRPWQKLCVQSRIGQTINTVSRKSPKEMSSAHDNRCALWLAAKLDVWSSLM